MNNRLKIVVFILAALFLLVMTPLVLDMMRDPPDPITIEAPTPVPEPTPTPIPTEGNGLTGWSASDYLHIDTAIPSTEPLPFLISVWGHVVTGDNGVGALVTVGQAGVFGHWRLLEKTTDDVFRVMSFDTATSVAMATDSIFVDTWHHTAGAFIANDRREVWFDGGDKGIDTGSIVPNAPDATRIGLRMSGDSPWLENSSMAEVSIWDVTGFTEAQRDALVLELSTIENGLARNPLDINSDSEVWENRLEAYWPMRNPEDIDDQSGNEFDMGMVGTLVEFDGPSPPVAPLPD